MPITANDRVRSSGFVTSAMYACASEMLPAVMPSIIRDRNTSQSELLKASRAKPSSVPI
jgi:hypothetical protein